MLGNNDPAFRAVAEHPRPGQRIVDLVRVVDLRSDGNPDSTDDLIVSGDLVRVGCRLGLELG